MGKVNDKIKQKYVGKNYLFFYDGSHCETIVPTIIAPINNTEKAINPASRVI